MHGWWWPGRQLVVVLPLAVIVIAVAADRSVLLFRSFAIAAVIGLVTWLWTTIEAITRRHVLVVDFAQTSNPWMRGRPRRWGALTMSTRLALGMVEITVRVTIDRPSRRRTARTRRRLRSSRPAWRSGAHRLDVRSHRRALCRSPRSHPAGTRSREHCASGPRCARWRTRSAPRRVARTTPRTIGHHPSPTTSSRTGP